MTWRNPVLDCIPEYVAGKPAEELARERGLARVLKIASNENPLGPSPGAIRALCEAAERAHIYPDDHCRDLAAAVAARIGVLADMLLFGTGSDDAMHLATWAFGEPGRAALVPSPGFGGYPIFAHSFGLRPVPVELPHREWDLNRFLDAARRENAAVVYLASPNNPTGTGLRHGDVVSFCEAIGGDALVVLDMAYREFDPDPDAPNDVAIVNAFENVVACRTFSKAYGLAGLRLGYAIASPARIRDMKKIRTPFAANGSALAAALAALKDSEHLEKSVRLARDGVAWWTERLAARGIRITPSRANFVMTDFGRDAAPIYSGLLDRGVIVRHLKSFGVPTALRITAGLPDDNEFALAMLDEVLSA
ncbi:MAG: histidinol-phosphate transaminase [Deltaproteobacteria bacterium]|nr:histidinol-phosphate transaminase [Deltaproteobacteria bacterium]